MSSREGLSPTLLEPQIHRGYLRSIVLLAGGSAAGQLLVIASTPLLTRLYSPSAIGLFSVYFTYVSFVAAVASLSYNTAIVSARDTEDAAALLWASLLFSVPGSAVGAAVMYGLSASGRLGFGELPSWASALAAVSIGLTSTYTTFRYWCVRQHQFGVVSRSSVAQNLGRVLGQLVGGLVNPAVGMLLLSDILGRVSGVRPTGLVAYREARAALDKPSWATLREALSRHRSFPAFYLPSTLINNLVVWLPLPLIVGDYGAAAGGYYAMASQVVSIPLVLVGTSVADVFHGSAARIVRMGERPLSLMWKTVGGLLALAAIPALVLALFAPDLFANALGPRWRTAGMIATAIVPWQIAQLCVSPVSRIVLICDGQRLKLVYDTSILLLTLGTFIVGSRNGVSLIHLVALLSVANVIGYLIYLGLLVRLASKEVTSCAALPAA